MTTEEGNKILRKFVGVGEDANWMLVAAMNINFDNDWSLLMRVVDKIESLHGGHHGRFVVHISSNTCSIQTCRYATTSRSCECRCRAPSGKST